MRIEAGAVIAGQPALMIRKLLHEATDSNCTLATIQHVLQVDLASAQRIYTELELEGYVEQVDIQYRSDGPVPRWRNTVKGNALAHATSRKPVKRSSAERVLEEFLKRVEEVNSSAEYLYRIKRVVLFGSFLSDQPTINDIDVCVWLDRKIVDPTEYGRRSEQRRIQAKQAGRQFKGGFEALIWPWQEVWLYLKGHSPTLSLHDGNEEQILASGIVTKVLYEEVE